MYGELLFRKTESVDVGKARRSIMTYPVSALNINESGDPPLHPPFSPLPLVLYNRSITAQTFESSQMAPVRYFPSHILIDS